MWLNGHGFAAPEDRARLEGHMIPSPTWGPHSQKSAISFSHRKVLEKNYWNKTTMHSHSFRIPSSVETGGGGGGASQAFCRIRWCWKSVTAHVVLGRSAALQTPLQALGFRIDSWMGTGPVHKMTYLPTRCSKQGGEASEASEAPQQFYKRSSK